VAVTQHPVRLFRLSCGCLRSYPMMPAGREHIVLCARCSRTVTTVAAYPDGACGVQGWAGRLMVSCGVADGCGWVHVDIIAGVVFTVKGPRLVRSREGKTGRA
jgi:hypothetical protein